MTYASERAIMDLLVSQQKFDLAIEFRGHLADLRKRISEHQDLVCELVRLRRTASSGQ